MPRGNLNHPTLGFESNAAFSDDKRGIRVRGLDIERGARDDGLAVGSLHGKGQAVMRDVDMDFAESQIHQATRLPRFRQSHDGQSSPAVHYEGVLAVESEPVDLSRLCFEDRSRLDPIAACRFDR